MMRIESIAAVCHEANRRYCVEHGDLSHKSWEEAPHAVQQSAIAGVIFHMQNPTASVAAQHEAWVKRKINEGWKYGLEKNEEVKTHPCIRLYEDLPDQQKVKDILFKAITLVLTNGAHHVA